MDSKIEEIKTYKGLGLTKNQAILYLTLVQSGISTVKQLSDCSKVAREEVYRIYPKLIELGLIKKIITSPIRFEAIPIKEGISLLIQRQIQEISDLHKKAKKLAEIAKKFSSKKTKSNFQKKYSSFIIIPKREALIRSIKQSIDSAQESISIITSMKRHPRAIYVYNGVIKKALSRGVKFRVVAGEAKEDIPEIAKKFSKHPFTSVKYISSPPAAVVVLVDNSKAFVMTSPTAELEESPALQLGNLSLIKLLQEYFEYVWIKPTGENEAY